MIDYLAPACRPSTLDGYGNVRLLLAAMKRAMPAFRGTLLDIGCGAMPYRPLIEKQAGVNRYIGLDLPQEGSPAHLFWDGKVIPLGDASVDSALLTEVLEHCPDAGVVLAEARRVLRPGGFLFATVPFIWPIHNVPYDEFRYTPYSLRRIFEGAGFTDVRIEATGGRHAMLAVALGLWVRRRAITSRRHLAVRWLLSRLLTPVVWLLMCIDDRPTQLGESTLLVGLEISARRP
ncbi:MAG TPA: class I SAM-dependent methyltransferase [Usitatibacter sp.]|nr:class I SAM-dependent methyltransferase [Usitatibacter sp.]